MVGKTPPEDEDITLLAQAAEDVVKKVDFILEDIDADPVTEDRMTLIAFTGPDGPTRVLLYRAGLAGMLMDAEEKVRHHLERYGYDPNLIDGLEPSRNAPFASVMTFMTHPSGTEEVRTLKFTRGVDADMVKHFHGITTPENREHIRSGSTEELRQQILQESAVRATEDSMGLTTPGMSDFIAILQVLNPLVGAITAKRARKEEGAD